MSTSRQFHRGFTLIELLVVLAIVALLLTIAAPRYIQSIDASRETLLIENLRVTRNVIDAFLADTGRYPESLDELVERRYMRALPYDPVADDATSWQIVPVPSSRNFEGNVFSATGSTRSGQPFSEL